MSLFIIVIIALPMLIVVFHNMVKSSFYDVIIQNKADKNKIKKGEPPRVETDQEKIDEYLKISNQVRCINMTVNYLTAYSVFITVVYLITNL